MLLIIEALLLILAALGQDHGAAVEGQIFPLDMAPNSVDDQYVDCTKEMVKLVENKFLMKEFKNCIEFQEAWKESEKQVIAPRDNLTRNHLIALLVYTGNRVYKNFSKDVRSDKSKYKDRTFKWYSLHFLLTEAIQILKRQQNKRYSVYRRTNAEFQGERGTKFRFGSFTSFSLDHSATIIFGDKSCFEISNYKGAELTNYSNYANEKEVLIPPYETFSVIDVRTKTDQPDLWCDTVFTLENTGTRSDLNCALFESSPNT